MPSCSAPTAGFRFIESTANNAVMVDQGERFIGDDFFELILGRAGARDVRRPRLGRHMIDPMPTERVVVDREFPCSSLNRRTRSEQPFDPHPLGVVASPTASCPRTLL